MRKALFFLLILCIGCRKDPPLPGQSQLIFPKSNEICTEGIIVSTTRSTIPFKWGVSINTNTYVLSIKNLENGKVLTFTTDKTQQEVELDRNAAYSWFILSRNTEINKEISSEIWKFYNPGPAQTSFSPFPADLIAPRYGEVITLATEKVTLKWLAVDPDGDIDSYDVYLGITDNPVLFRTGLKESVLADLILDRNKTYFWKINTRDKKGNRSDSAIYTFKLD